MTVFNDGPDRRTATIRLDGPPPASGRELLTGEPIRWENGQTTLTLDGEDVAVLEIGP